jgi:hypothetical protein
MIYQIYYNEKTRGCVHPLCEGYDNSLHPGKSLQPAFENHVISELIEKKKHIGHEYFGVFSWGFENKTGKRFDRIFEEVQEKEADIYAFNGKNNNAHIWRQANVWHPGLLAVSQSLVDKLGYNINLYDLSVKHGGFNYTVYGNHFITSPEIYEAYVKEMLDPALWLMFTDESLIERLNKNSGYNKTRRDLLERMPMITGKPYYTLHTFVCERLFSTWLALNKKYSIKHI